MCGCVVSHLYLTTRHIIRHIESDQVWQWCTTNLNKDIFLHDILLTLQDNDFSRFFFVGLSIDIPSGLLSHSEVVCFKGKKGRNEIKRRPVFSVWLTDEGVDYYESIKWELKKRCIYECRCDERLQTKTKEFTRLGYTGLVVELGHRKIETRLIDEKFVNVMGEYVT